MAPQWMPQNIQKRLLLYVLQQLSLFSGIDLENLDDVSLGSSSQITLNDVELDTEAFKIPGVHLRNGRIKNLQLKLNVSGGVNFDVDGLFITMALSNTANAHSTSNTLSKSTASMLQSILSDRSKETLAQSTIDLAQTLMQDEEFHTPEQSYHQSFDASSRNEGGPQSTLNSMMSKAVEIALARLNVSIQNISVRVIMEHATVDVEIKSASLVTENGIRSIKFSEVMFMSTQPSVNPGEFEKSNTEQALYNAAVEEPEVHDDLVESSSSDEEDHDNSAMTSSSVLERTKDLESSLLYSKEEASSIYMSAASDTFEARRKEVLDGTRLLSINEVIVTFEESLKVEKLKIEVDHIRVAAVPLPLTILHIIESLGVLNPQESYHRSSNVGHKLRKENEGNQTQSERENNIFESLDIQKVEIGLVSALLLNGQFSKPYELRLVAEGINLKSNGSNLFYGGIPRVYLADGLGDIIGQFQGDSTKHDVRFEKKLDVGCSTLLFYKDLAIELEQKHLQRFIDLTGFVQQIVESLGKLGHGKQVIQRHSNSSNTIQTSNITVVLKLNENLKLSIKITPLSLDSKDSSVMLSKISIVKIENDAIFPMVVISNLCYQVFGSEKQLRTHDNKGHELTLITKSLLNATNITVGHSFADLLTLKSLLTEYVEGLLFPHEPIIFKTRNKARISSNLAYNSRPAVPFFATVDTASITITDINEEFGDVTASFKKMILFAHNDRTIQFHLTKGEISRSAEGKLETFFRIVNPDDKSAPILSLRAKSFKNVNVFLRNVMVDYYTEWLNLFGDSTSDHTEGNSQAGLEHVTDQKKSISTSRTLIQLSLVDVAIGLNPGRLKAKAILVISNGTLEVVIDHQTTIKSELRSSSLQLIDDKTNVLSHESAKKHRDYNKAWSQASYFHSKGFITAAKSNNIGFQMEIKPSVDTHGQNMKLVKMMIFTEALELELCADSSQCLIQLVNDLKQPLVIRPESKYKINGKEIDVFNDVELNAFNGGSILEDQNLANELFKNGHLDVVDDYYESDRLHRTTFPMELDRSSASLDLQGNGPTDHSFYDQNRSTNTLSESKSVNSDSTLLFDEGHFEQNLTSPGVDTGETQFPMVLDLKIGKLSIKIFDGYDWKYTRSTITSTVKQLEKRVREQQNLKNEMLRQGTVPGPVLSTSTENRIIGETLFDSIHVSVPLNSEDPSQLTQNINMSLQSVDGNTIEFGKNGVRKLKLHRTRFHKVLIELFDISLIFTVFSNQDPMIPSELSSSLADEYEVANEIIIYVSDFEITDNVPSSTWNKFVTLLKDVEREKLSSMLQFKIKTIRPILSSAATELIIDAEVLPLRLHVDQDTLEVLIRFGEFKDSRFQLIDEYEDIIYVQKFTINAIKVKLDYKPKKIDYAGLRSGHTTELMNLFILDEASMILKSVTLYGVSGLPRLGQLLNDLWMPDIKQTQLTGVLSGLAPVRSIYQIGSNFKDLVVVPMDEYRKDGRIYRSLAKGVAQFSKNTTNELLKFGIKLANGTQTLLENAEYALGGVGSAARLPHDVNNNSILEVPEDEYSDDDNDLAITDGDDTRFGLQSQLIGKSSLQQPLHRSSYEPPLEAFTDLNIPNKSQNQGNWFSNAHSRNRVVQYQVLDDMQDLIEDEAEDESQKTLSLYANQPSNLREGLVLAYDSLGRNFLVAKDAITNAGYEISEGGSAQSLTIAIAKATPVALLRPIIGATEAASRALYGLNNELDPSSRKYTDDKYKQTKER